MATEGIARAESSVERLKLFSDAVVAIAITLLALELPIPAGATAHEFWHSVHHEDGHYLAFLISFAVIGAAWIEHYKVFDAIDFIDAGLRLWCLLWLFTIVLTPFATRVLTSAGHETITVHAIRFGFYALVETISSVAMLAMIRHAVHRSLEAEHAPEQILREVGWDTLRNIAGFALSIPLFFVLRQAWALWFAGPLLVSAAQRIVTGRRPQL